MVLYVPNLVQLIGLGLAIDYSLLIVHRFRQELADEDRPVEDAIVATMATAGRTVVLSGAAVAIGLCRAFHNPGPVPALARCGRVPGPGGLGPGRPLASAGPALPSRPPGHRRPRPSPARSEGRGPSRPVVTAGAHGHAPARRVMAVGGHGRAARRGHAGGLAPAHAGVGHGRPARHPGRSRPGPAARPGRPGVITPIEVVLDSGAAPRRAHARRQCRHAPARSRAPRPAGRVRRRHRHAPALRRLFGPVPPHGGDRAGGLRGRGVPTARSPHPRPNAAGGPFPARRTGLCGRRPGSRRRFPEPRLRQLSPGSSSSWPASSTWCCSGLSAPSCCR